MSWFSLCRTSPFSASPFSILGFGSVRTATKRAGGTVRNHGGSPGKRLGVKKFSGEPTELCTRLPLTCLPDQYVIPGNIIVRQRGSQFHPGQHVRSRLFVYSMNFHVIR
jgi:large subunit ribosomal protein L27